MKLVIKEANRTIELEGTPEEINVTLEALGLAAMKILPSFPEIFPNPWTTPMSPFYSGWWTEPFLGDGTAPGLKYTLTDVIESEPVITIGGPAGQGHSHSKRPIYYK